MGKPDLDMAGRAFGFLTVLAESARGKNGVVWHCLCQCGAADCVEDAFYLGTSLRTGRIKSCGAVARGERDLRGMRFGHLHPEQYAFSRVGEQTRGRWWCRCVCGHIRCPGHVFVPQKQLMSGQSSTCGTSHHLKMKVFAGRAVTRQEFIFATRTKNSNRWNAMPFASDEETEARRRAAVDGTGPPIRTGPEDFKDLVIPDEAKPKHRRGRKPKAA